MIPGLWEAEAGGSQLLGQLCFREGEGGWSRMKEEDYFMQCDIALKVAIIT